MWFVHICCCLERPFIMSTISGGGVREVWQYLTYGRKNPYKFFSCEGGGWVKNRKKIVDIINERPLWKRSRPFKFDWIFRSIFRKIYQRNDCVLRKISAILDFRGSWKYKSFRWLKSIWWVRNLIQKVLSQFLVENDF